MRKPRSEYPSEQADKFLLRFPEGMHARLKAEAEANKRSMNAEIVARLEESLVRPEIEAARAKYLELNNMIETYNFESQRLARMQNDIERITESLQMMHQTLREAGVIFTDSKPADEPSAD